MRKQDKWRKRFGKVAAPIATAGAVAGTVLLAGGRDVIEAVPESVQGVANIVKETGSLLTTGIKTTNFLLENLFVISAAVGAGFVGYKIYTR